MAYSETSVDDQRKIQLLEQQIETLEQDARAHPAQATTIRKDINEAKEKIARLRLPPVQTLAGQPQKGRWCCCFGASSPPPPPPVAHQPAGSNGTQIQDSGSSSPSQSWFSRCFSCGKPKADAGETAPLINERSSSRSNSPATAGSSVSSYLPESVQKSLTFMGKGKAFWGRRSTGQKVAIIIGGVIILGGLGAFFGICLVQKKCWGGSNNSSTTSASIPPTNGTFSTFMPTNSTFVPTNATSTTTNTTFLPSVPTLPTVTTTTITVTMVTLGPASTTTTPTPPLLSDEVKHHLRIRSVDDVMEIALLPPEDTLNEFAFTTIDWPTTWSDWNPYNMARSRWNGQQAIEMQNKQTGLFRTAKLPLSVEQFEIISTSIFNAMQAGYNEHDIAFVLDNMVKVRGLFGKVDEVDHIIFKPLLPLLGAKIWNIHPIGGQRTSSSGELLKYVATLLEQGKSFFYLR